MAKRQKFHKIIIHPNRYLIWACCIALIVAIGLVSYVHIYNVNQVSSGDSNMNLWRTYQDANLSLRYPASWVVESDSDGTSFGTANQDLFLVQVSIPANAAAYSSYSKTSGATSVNVDQTLGLELPKDSSGEAIVFVKTNQALYAFRGSSPLFDRILSTIKLNKK